MTEMVHEFGGALRGEDVTVGAEMENGGGAGGEKGIGLDGGPVAVDGGERVGKGGAVRGQDTAEIEEVRIGGDMRSGLSPLGKPIGGEPDIVFEDKMICGSRSSVLFNGRPYILVAQITSNHTLLPLKCIVFKEPSKRGSKGEGFPVHGGMTCRRVSE
jgi:hypothetical protein